MVRPKRRRRLCCCHKSNFYKPAGIPSTKLKTINLLLDEIEAIRLCDAEQLNQTKAAEMMNISQSTLNRILSSARKKIAKALIEGNAISIDEK